MKKTIAKYIRSFGGEPHYSGKDRTMYIDDNRKEEEKDEAIEFCVQFIFQRDIPFTLKTN